MNLLLVEDNAADMRLLQVAFAECAPQVELRWAADADTALAALRRSVPDLVLLDLNLPRIGGAELLAQIKGDPALVLVPVVALTSSAARADVVAAYRAHANAYMLKPGSYDECLVFVGRLLAYWSMAVLLPSRVQ